MNLSRILLLALLAVLLGGCASSKSGNVYPRYQARQEMLVRMGMLESVRPVELEGTQTGAGTMTGAALGGLAGSNAGRGHGHIAGGIIGAVIGAIVGNAIENEATRRPGLELTVRLDDGQMIAVVQEGDPQEFRPGDRVRVLSGADGTRVTR